MLSIKPLSSVPTVNNKSYDQLYPDTIDQFLQMFSNKVELLKIYNGGMTLNFKLKSSNGIKHKISPILKLATPQDAKELVSICKEVYEDSYPYHEMQDEQTVLKMLKSPHHHFILFKDQHHRIIGCFRCALDFENKKGYMGGFMVRKQYQKIIDVVKAIVGSYIWMWTTFSEKILVWYCENRTSHASSQHMTAVCGIKTIGFLPNKDIFYGNIESDVIGIIYRKRALSHLRDPQLPSLIYPAYGCFLHAKNLYNLGKCRILANKLNPVCKKVPENSVKILRRFEQDEFGYEIIYLFLSHSSSYFKILHTTHLQNLEKAEYQVDNIEELYVFVKELRAIMKEKNVRYCELFVSAYEPEHQAVFYQLGFTPRGYIPCWKYNKGTKLFEDCILFNYYEGELAPMNLIQDGLKLLNKIQLNPN